MTHERPRGVIGRILNLRRLALCTPCLCIIVLALPEAAAVGREGCTACHAQLQGQLGDVVPLFENSVHGRIGMSCTSCHGGDPSATEAGKAKDPETGFISAPRLGEITTLCGSCHSSAAIMKRYNPTLPVDQVDEYMTSAHGILSARGDTGVATCTSCHSVHDIRRVDDPMSPAHRLKMAETCGTCHPDELSQYRTSRHGAAHQDEGLRTAPTCNDCHGDHGAVPPGATSVANVCSRCHERQRDLFSESSHSEIFAIRGLKGCIECHENHSVDEPRRSLFSGSSAACLPCHESDEGAKTAERWGMQVMALRHRIDASRAVLSDAEKAGINVGGSIRNLSLAWEKVTAVRNEVHTFDDDRVTAAIQEAQKLAEQAHQGGMLALDDFQSRRQGLYILLSAAVMASLVGTMFVGRSIVLRRRETEALRLERERLARIGEISAGVAHTIRNPLHGILNCVDILKAKTPPGDPNQNILGLMSEGLQQIQNVTQRLLGLTRESTMQKSATDINVLIEDTCRFIEVRCQNKGVRVRMELDGAGRVMMDAQQMSEALLNVLDNALAASGPGDTVRIRTSVTTAEGGWLVVEVVDEGVGISPEHRQKIFDPFFSTKPIGEGSGLGLGITKRIVESHGGKVRIQSRLGEGTQVSLSIPLS